MHATFADWLVFIFHIINEVGSDDLPKEIESLKGPPLHWSENRTLNGNWTFLMVEISIFPTCSGV